jgi:fibronectin type 3 domain-containing protein
MIALTRRLLGASLLATAVLFSACSDDDDDSGVGPVVVPAVPTGLTVTALSANSNRITWTASAGATSYSVERAAGAAGSFAEIATPSGTSYDDIGLDGEQTYRYRVAAVNSAGKSAISTEAAPGSQPVVDVTQNVTTNTTWSKANVYLLKGFIQVANGATLTIEPGTKILGDFNTLGTALFVLRGARIVANGTAAEPIVFTSSRPVGQRQPGDWGGLILVGNGIINRANPLLEGTGGQTGAPEVLYGNGTNNADNSGVLRYVRVEFAGFATAPNAELNTFTFAAVGSGTTIENLQALSGLDDSYEWFGGAVDAKNLISYEAGDDHFDMSEGYVGRLQNLIAYQTRVLTPRPQAGNVSSDPQGIENDGCDGPGCALGEESTPYTIPLVANFTLVGTGPGVVPAGGGNAMVLRRGTGGYYVNGHISRFPNSGIALRNGSTTLVGTGNRIADGSLVVRNILVTDQATLLETGANRLTVDLVANALELQSAVTTTSVFTAFPATPTTEGSLDWSPSAAAPQRTGGTGAFTGTIATKAGTFITGTAYRGAADPAGAKWWAGWTNYAAN